MAFLPELLPNGYEFTHAGEIKAAEVVALRDASEWGTERDENLWRRVLQESIAATGVRDEERALIGIGFLAGNLRHAVLCDFLVHPDHQCRGIGTAILHRRLNIAEGLNIPYLYTELSPTNKLRSRYEALGFSATGSAYTRAARRHPLELQ